MFKIREFKLREKMGRIKRLTSATLTKSKVLSLRVKGFFLPLFRQISHFTSDKFRSLIKKNLARAIWQKFVLGLTRVKKIRLKGLLEGREVLGLDIGTSSIKVTRLTKTRRGVKILNFWEKEIPRERRGEVKDEKIARTITELLSSIPGEKKIISSLPASSFVIKRLSLPFKGSRRVRQVIKYELEPHLPFPLEEAIIDFYIVDDRLPDRTLVLAFAINQRVVEKHLKILDRAGIRPEIVGLDSTSLFNVYFPKKDKETIALINLGAGQTIINIISEGRLLFTRSILKAGDDITQALAEELGVNSKEAERLKKEGLDETKTKAIKPVLDEIKKEIEYTLSSFLAFYSDKKIEKILLTGGSARLPGMVEYFQRSLNIETSLFNPFFKLSLVKPFYSRLKDLFIPPLKEISSNIDSVTLEKTLPLLPLVMGIALRGMARTKASLNFIREEKPLIKRLEEARSLLKPATILLVSILLLGLLDFYLHLYLKNKRSTKLEKEIRLVFNKTFPEVTNIVNPLVQMKDNLEKREEDLALSPREFSSLSILREISSVTPKDLGITLEDISIDWKETRIKGRTDFADFSLIDGFKKALEDSDYFAEVEVGDARLSRGGRSVKFRMTIKHGEER